MPTQPPTIRTEVPADDPRQLHVIIDNPSARNGLNRHITADIARIVGAAGEDDAVRCVVIRGAGDHFCSGADLRSGAGVLKEGDDGFRRILSDGYHAAIRAIFECPKPTLAVIRGAAVGFGFDLALAADLRICAHESRFGQVFTKLGLVPDGGSSFTLPRLVGLGKAMELMLLADRFDGHEAARIGLVNTAVPDAELDEAAAALARRLADGPPLAYRLAKANLRAGAGGGTMAEALHREQEAQVLCIKSKDALIGGQAFFLKQQPKFEGR
jgi:2-(1,2-epoxy-1,2-dihydrophenyl)acetyl-CoA isomerase